MSEEDENLAPEESTGLPEFATDPRGVLRRRWRWMVLAGALVATATAAVILTRPEMYQASAQLLVTSQRVPEEFVRQITIETMGEQVSAIVGEILSSDSLEELADENGYLSRSEFEGSESDLVGHIRDAISVERDRERSGGTTHIFAIQFRSGDPQLAADMANGVVDRFTSAHARRQTRQAQLTTQFLRRDAERARSELEAIRKEIASFKGRHQGELPAELDTKLARLTRLQQQRDSLATQISDAESRVLALHSQGVGDQRTELLHELRGKLVNQLTVHTEDHPNVRALERQIAELERQLQDEPPSRSSDASPAAIQLQQEIQSLRRQIQKTEVEIADLDEQVSHIPGRQEELAALEQQENLLQERYVEASRKVRDAELAESLQREQQGINVSVLQPAWPPKNPQGSLLKFLLLGVVGTLGATVGIALLFEIVDPVVLSTRQLERATGLATLGVVPKIR